jgi:hypothetical protein
MNPAHIKTKHKRRKKPNSHEKVSMAPKVHKETEKLTKGGFEGNRWVPYDKK